MTLASRTVDRSTGAPIIDRKNSRLTGQSGKLTVLSLVMYSYLTRYLIQNRKLCGCRQLQCRHYSVVSRTVTTFLTKVV
jgi:hypothetical protein